MNVETLKINKPFELESGEVLPEIEIAYTVFGNLNPKTSKVIWIVHALTANADPSEWWNGIVGEGKLFNPEEYCIISTNNLGSCYGTTGPSSINPKTNSNYGDTFPLITIRDLVKANQLLANHLEIEKIFLLTGGSMGGQVSLEWAIMNPGYIEHLVPIATNARHSAWGIAFNEAQRMAMKSNEYGLEAARAIALLSYRGYDTYEVSQTDNNDVVDNFKASSYQNYQGQKLSARFDKDSYHLLSKTMDSHNVGRGRGSLENALASIRAKTLVIGISSDILFPVKEQEYISSKVHAAQLKVINSNYGHDGFLIEYAQLMQIIGEFIKGE